MGYWNPVVELETLGGTDLLSLVLPGIGDPKSGVFGQTRGSSFWETGRPCTMTVVPGYCCVTRVTQRITVGTLFPNTYYGGT